MTKELKYATGNRYQLAPECPCGKSNADGKFHPFVGYQDKGYCHSCGKTFWPKGHTPSKVRHPTNLKAPEPKRIPSDLVKASMKYQDRTNLFAYLVGLFDYDRVMTAMDRYFVGTSRKYQTLFWYVDQEGWGRKARVVSYQPDGHRDKNGTWWMKEFTNEKGFLGCIYGEHLIKDNQRPLYLFEAEKTALMASIYEPGKIHLATGGAASLRKDKLDPLRGHQVILVCDADQAGREGFQKLKRILLDAGIVASVQDPFPDRQDGYDWGDFIHDQVHDPIMSKQDLELEALIQKNPALATLVNRFDLAYQDSKETPTIRIKRL